MSTTFVPLPLLLLLPPRVWLMRLMSASLLMLPSSASMILPMDCLKLVAVFPIVAELVACRLLRSRPVTCLVTPRPSIPRDELEL